MSARVGAVFDWLRRAATALESAAPLASGAQAARMTDLKRPVAGTRARARARARVQANARRCRCDQRRSLRDAAFGWRLICEIGERSIVFRARVEGVIFVVRAPLFVCVSPTAGDNDDDEAPRRQQQTAAGDARALMMRCSSSALAHAKGRAIRVAAKTPAACNFAIAARRTMAAKRRARARARAHAAKTQQLAANMSARGGRFAECARARVSITFRVSQPARSGSICDNGCRRCRRRRGIASRGWAPLGRRRVEKSARNFAMWQCDGRRATGGGGGVCCRRPGARLPLSPGAHLSPLRSAKHVRSPPPNGAASSLPSFVCSLARSFTRLLAFVVAITPHPSKQPLHLPTAPTISPRHTLNQASELPVTSADGRRRTRAASSANGGSWRADARLSLLPTPLAHCSSGNADKFYFGGSRAIETRVRTRCARALGHTLN